MGTSSAYEAPTSNDWPNLKAQVTRFARDGVTSLSSEKDILQKFIRSNEEGSSGERSSAQDTARRVGEFVSSVASLGLQHTLESYGLSELVGEPVEHIIPAIVDKLGGPSSTLNDSDARNVLSKLMNELLGDLETPEQVEQSLEQVLAQKDLENLLSKFFGYYLYEQFCRVFYERLVNRVGRQNANSYLKSIFDTIEASLALKVSERDLSRVDWRGPEGQSLAGNILKETFEIFGS